MDENPDERGRERRAQPRFEVNDEATLLLLADGRLLPSRVQELSLEGCRLRTRERFKAGAGVRVEVAFRVNGIAFRLLGVTQWTNEWNVVGIQFVDVPPRRVRELADAVGEMEVDAASRADWQALEELAAESKPGGEAAAKEPAERAGERAEEPAEEQAWIHIVTHEVAGMDAAARPAGYLLPGPMKGDRRVEPRLAVETTAAICLIRSGSRLAGRILDLSLDGCRILSDEPIPVEIYTRIETEFQLDGFPFRLAGVIQAIHDRRDVGIRFLDVSERKLNQLGQLMKEIEEDRSSSEPEAPQSSGQTPPEGLE